MIDFKQSREIVLRRVENGWVVRLEKDSFWTNGNDKMWVFASTASLCRQLPALIGESGWEVQPARDAKGHFVSPKADPIPPVIFKKAV